MLTALPRVCLFTLSFLFITASTSATQLRLCGGEQVREGSVIKTSKGNLFETQWTWRAESSSGLPDNLVLSFAAIDDCKPSLDGREMLVSSSKGAVAVIAYPSGNTLFYAAVPNAHSIETLPNRLVVAASSTNPKGDRLVFFDRDVPDKPMFEMPLVAAHGVTWDAKRNVLWALGDEALLKLHVARAGSSGVTVETEKRYPLPNRGGHDLLLAHDGSSLYITISPKVMTFNIDEEKFADFPKLAGLKGVKSIGFDPTTGRLAYTQAEPRVWWTYTVRFQEPNDTVTLERETFKIRWAAR